MVILTPVTFKVCLTMYGKLNPLRVSLKTSMPFNDMLETGMCSSRTKSMSTVPVVETGETNHTSLSPPYTTIYITFHCCECCSHHDRDHVDQNVGLCKLFKLFVLLLELRVHGL